MKVSTMKWIACLSIALIAVLCHRLSAGAAEELRVFHRWIEWSDGGAMLMKHLNTEAFSHLDERNHVIASLRSTADWERRQKETRF